MSGRRRRGNESKVVSYDATALRGGEDSVRETFVCNEGMTNTTDARRATSRPTRPVSIEATLWMSCDQQADHSTCSSVMGALHMAIGLVPERSCGGKGVP